MDVYLNLVRDELLRWAYALAGGGFTVAMGVGAVIFLGLAVRHRRRDRGSRPSEQRAATAGRVTAHVGQRSGA
jgi:hypothetical protein